jgi:hypothetical protein
MEFTGVCINKAETRTGEGKNGTWKSLEFVLEDSTGQYPKKAMFEAGTKSYDFAAKIKQGDTVKVQYDVDCNEYKGRYYNKLKAFKIEVVGEAQQWTKQPQSNNSDMPF